MRRHFDWDYRGSHYCAAECCCETASTQVVLERTADHPVGHEHFWCPSSYFQVLPVQGRSHSSSTCLARHRPASRMHACLPPQSACWLNLQPSLSDDACLQGLQPPEACYCSGESVA